MRSAEQIVLDAFRGRTYVTIGEVIALVEELMVASAAASRREDSCGHGQSVTPQRRGRKARR
jgi:hypothetical protein